MLPAILGLLAGAGKSLGDAAGAESDRRVAGQTSRWSPWTKMQAQTPRKVNPIGTMLGGLSAGLQLGEDNPNFDSTVINGVGDVGNAIGGVGKKIGSWLGIGSKDTGIAAPTATALQKAGTHADLGIDEGGVNEGIANYPSTSSWAKLLQMQNRRGYNGMES